MSVSDGLAEFLLDAFRPLGAVRIRRMFAAAGVFCGDTMFALIADETLFLKADDGNRADFEAEHLEPISYVTKDGRNTIMSYWQAPERLLDDPEELLTWASKALVAARRSGVKAKRAADVGRSQAEKPKRKRPSRRQH